MTPRELDRARAAEAERLWLLEPNVERGLLLELAARLGREGWQPPDPLKLEIDKIMGKVVYCMDEGGWAFSPQPCFDDLLREAMERGIEMGREQARAGR